MDEKIRLGVAAMDRKARSKPMRNILSRLVETGKFDVIIFGDKVILDEAIEDWPICDYLISFFSNGFPLDKAISYVHLRKPICINDLPLQKVFWDRRIVLSILDAIGVPTPRRIEVDRDGGPKIDKEIADQIESNLGVRVDKPRPVEEIKMKDDDELITVVGCYKSLRKPFVEKPVSGEDHNINIYFSKNKGGGARKLFRKVENKSSEFLPDLALPRTQGSFVYEEFMDVENAEDIKVYTLGPNFVHAESRKSPVVDGVVRRNIEGKEIRFITQLTDEEKKIAKDISIAFKQNICGFDLLRAGGKSYVIDVNGWSFVKGNDYYYEKCAEILFGFCKMTKPKIYKSPDPQAPGSPGPREKSWHLKSTTCVFRHADRTPKMKMKFNFKNSDEWTKPFFALLQGRRDEIILRKSDQLNYIIDAAANSMEIKGAEVQKLAQMSRILREKLPYPGTKAQLKPSFGEDGEVDKVQIIVKWGGEFTHSAKYQSRDLGENMRKDTIIMNSSILENSTIYSSSERRVVATAEIFSSAFLEDRKVRPLPTSSHSLIIRKDLLDDSNAAKQPMDQVKTRLKTLLRPGEYKRPEFAWAVPDVEPVQVVRETIELMKYHRDVMNKNFEILDVLSIQPRWCCGEWPELFKERWDKLFSDFCDAEPERFDPSRARVSELYDSLKYDALHNRVFLEHIFSHHDEANLGNEDMDGPGHNPPKQLKDLYRNAKVLFDLIAPQEYGIERSEKEEIGLLTSLPLLEKIVQDLRDAKTVDTGAANFYFTKESHIQTLVNLIILSDLPKVMLHTPELDYMAFIAFEVWERQAGPMKEFSLRISLSSGAHSSPLDASLDTKHALQVQPRRLITNHIPLDEALSTLSQYSRHASIIKKSTTPFEGMLPVEGDEIFAGKKPRHVEYVDFKPERPRSVASSMDGTGTESE